MSETPPKRGRGRPRREGADDEILAVALAMLQDLGYGALTLDAVAERAGVAKTTIYRRWPSKGDLVAAAMAPLAAQSDADDADGIVNEAASLLRLFSPPDGDVLEVIAAILGPRHGRLRGLVGGEEADRLIGALLTRLLVTREPV
jgi:AcrR family transcriptional regulator